MGGGGYVLLVTRARIVGQVTLGGGGRGVCAAGYKGEDCWTGDARRWGGVCVAGYKGEDCWTGDARPEMGEGGYVLLVTRARIVGQVTLGGGGRGVCAAGYKGEDCWTGDVRRWGEGGMCCWLQGRGLLDR